MTFSYKDTSILYCTRTLWIPLYCYFILHTDSVDTLVLLFYIAHGLCGHPCTVILYCTHSFDTLVLYTNTLFKKKCRRTALIANHTE